MGQDRRGGARRPRGRMTQPPGPGQGTHDASPKISCASQAGDLREEAGVGMAMGRKPDLQEGIQDTEESETGCVGNASRRWTYGAVADLS